ncbi:MAG: hypothetical protein HYZ28_14885 [Myxococcales bacterium]|nr:hypothetical protein [Myxococcales bacterium]
MIRIATFDPYEEKQLKRLCEILYTAFAVGTEHSSNVRLPEGFAEPYEAARLLEEAPRVHAYADDKVLFLTSKKLKDRALPSGSAPTNGLSKYAGEKAIITTSVVKDLEQGMKTVARHALHQLGHTWELHHCLDPRCAMYPTWTPSFPQGEPIFCPFCRDRSDQKIRLAKS